MKKSELTFSLISVPVDFIMLILSAITAYFIRFQALQEIRPVIYAIPFNRYLNTVILISMAWLVIFAITGLYSTKQIKFKISQILLPVTLGCSLGVLLVIVLIFFRKEELFSSRFIVIAIWGLSIVFIYAGRIILKYTQRIFYHFNLGNHRVIIIGDNKITTAIINEFKKNISMGYTLVEQYRDFDDNIAQKIINVNKLQKIDDLFVAKISNHDELLAIKDFADEYHLDFHYAADIFNASHKNINIDTINSIPFIEIKKTPLDGWGRIIKRLFDIILAIIGIIIFSPIMIIAAIAIKATSKGPIIYKNERVSKDGNFYAYKFRYMKIEYCTGQLYGGEKALEYEQKLIAAKNLKPNNPVYKIADDPRKTSAGKWIERFSIDDVPQFFNVLVGDMSLVGPRPHQPREVEKYQKHHKKVLSIKPGMTGLAQISGRSDLDFEDEVKLDNYYIENWSLGKDLYIILKTPLALLRKRKNFS